jgi:hypothetical protein
MSRSVAAIDEGRKIQRADFDHRAGVVSAAGLKGTQWIARIGYLS